MTDTIWLPDLSDQDGPKFRALANAIRTDIRRGHLTPGTRLPAMRDLAWRLGMTPGTVARAYQIAASEGIVDSQIGRGSFVATPEVGLRRLQPLLDQPDDGLPGTHARADSGPLDLRSPRLPDLGQAQSIRDAFAAMAQTASADILDYAPLGGDTDCLRAFADWLGPEAAGLCGPDDIVLTYGGQSAILLILSICLGRERPRVLCEALSYPGLRHAARLLRAEVAPVAQDGQGMRPDDLDRVARQSGARVVFLTPSAQNPTAGRMDAERRAALIQVARRHDLQVIEDETYPSRPGALRAADAPPALRALAPERVWHITGLSKLISAGLRFGALVCPTGMAAPARLTAQHSFFGMSRPLSLAMARLLRDPQVTEQAAQVLAELDARGAIARQIFAETPIRTLADLPYVWLPLPARWRASAFVQHAGDRGILIRSADEFAASNSTEMGRLAAAPLTNAVRVGLAGHLPRVVLSGALQELRRLYDAPPQDDMVV